MRDYGTDIKPDSEEVKRRRKVVIANSLRHYGKLPVFSKVFQEIMNEAADIIEGTPQ